MGNSLLDIAQTLKSVNKKVQLIYAFNGIGKTRLSREFKNLVSPKAIEEVVEDSPESKIKIMYYNAFTEDLFYWDNDLDTDTIRKLIIRPNSFTNLVLQVLQEQGLDGNIVSNFQHFTNQFLTPLFSPDFSEVTFSIQRGDDEGVQNIKISKGEESNFIWCVFFSLIEYVVELLSVPEPSERESSKFNELEYIFIDDPVSSLDDNHLIELAVNLASLIKKARNLKFIITTHNPLFFNVLFNELDNKICYLFNKFDNGTFELIEKKGDSNKSFSYHLHLKYLIEEAIKNNSIEKFHFTLIRNLYEKTANFLGYQRWSELLPGDKQLYYNRVIQFTSHSTLSNETLPVPTEAEKQIVKFLLDHLTNNYNFWKEIAT